MPEEMSEADYAALAEFRHALRSFLVFSEERAAEHGLTPQQHQALLAIRAAPAEGVTVGYLAQRLIIKPHSASGLVDRLQALGLVTRMSPVHDRRQALVTLTPKAFEALARLSSANREELKRLRPTLSAFLAQLG